MNDLHDYLDPLNTFAILQDEALTDGQIGKHIEIFEEHLPDLSDVDVVIIGVPEYRGNLQVNDSDLTGPDAIREKWYRLHYWHTDVRIADFGNVKQGKDIYDTYAAVKTIVSELVAAGKRVIILGGSHDLTLAQYEAYRSLERTVDVTCIDAAVDLHSGSSVRSQNFLLDLLTGEPNLVKHYNHIGFQSFYVHPRMMETLNKLHFDCFRVGKVQEMIEDIEPPIRHTDMLSFDICAIKNSDSPASTLSPNGFTGAEACMLLRYAGMSNQLSTAGIYGYHPDADRDGLSAMQIAQMMWYFIDGYQKLKHDAIPGDESAFIEYETAFAQIKTTFIQSKKSQRWWMRMPDNKWVACTYRDYMEASANLYPERWLRVQERDC